MNTTTLRISLSITFVATTLMACASFTDAPGESTEEPVGQLGQALRCTTCGNPEPEPPEQGPRPPQQGPSITCTGGDMKVVDGECVKWGCPQTTQKTVADAGGCTGFSVIGRYPCPTSYPVQRCAYNGECTCWSR